MWPRCPVRFAMAPGVSGISERCSGSAIGVVALALLLLAGLLCSPAAAQPWFQTPTPTKPRTATPIPPQPTAPVFTPTPTSTPARTVIASPAPLRSPVPLPSGATLRIQVSMSLDGPPQQPFAVIQTWEVRLSDWTSPALACQIQLDSGCILKLERK